MELVSHKEMNTKEKISRAEEAIVNLALALNIPEEKIVISLRDGLDLNGLNTPHVQEVFEELNSTFDAL